MNPYTEEEIRRINQRKESNDKLEEFFSKERENWNDKCHPLFESINIKIDSNTSSRIIDSQSLCLSYRQIVNDQISSFLSKRSKQESKLKKVKQDKFLFYATNFGVKTNLSEKILLIEAHIAEDQRSIELIESHIEFLRQLNKNFESLNYSIKNLIELFNYLGK